MSQNPKVTDLQVLQAARFHATKNTLLNIQELLVVATGKHPKVCWRAMERCEAKGYLDCGVSLRVGWLTEEGKAKLAELMPNQEGAR